MAAGLSKQEVINMAQQGVETAQKVLDAANKIDETPTDERIAELKKIVKKSVKLALIIGVPAIITLITLAAIILANQQIA